MPLAATDAQTMKDVIALVHAKDSSALELLRLWTKTTLRDKDNASLAEETVCQTALRPDVNNARIIKLLNKYLRTEKESLDVLQFNVIQDQSKEPMDLANDVPTTNVLSRMVSPKLALLQYVIPLPKLWTQTAHAIHAQVVKSLILPRETANHKPAQSGLIDRMMVFADQTNAQPDTD